MTTFLKGALCAIIMAGSVTSGFAQEPVSYAQQTRAIFAHVGSKMISAGSTLVSKGTEAAQWTSAHATDAFKAISDKTVDFAQKTSTGWSDAFKAFSQKVGQGCYQASQAAASGFNWAVDKTPEGIKDFATNHPYITGMAIATPVAILIGYKMAKANQVKAVQVTTPLIKHEEQKQQPVLYIKLKPHPKA